MRKFSKFQKRSKSNSNGKMVSIMTLSDVVRNCPIVIGAGPESKYPTLDSTAVGASPHTITSPTVSQ